MKLKPRSSPVEAPISAVKGDKVIVLIAGTTGVDAVLGEVVAVTEGTWGPESSLSVEISSLVLPQRLQFDWLGCRIDKQKSLPGVYWLAATIEGRLLGEDFYYRHFSNPLVERERASLLREIESSDFWKLLYQLPIQDLQEIRGIVRNIAVY